MIVVFGVIFAKLVFMHQDSETGEWALPRVGIKSSDEEEAIRVATQTLTGLLIEPNKTTVVGNLEDTIVCHLRPSVSVPMRGQYFSWDRIFKGKKIAKRKKKLPPLEITDYTKKALQMLKDSGHL